MGNRIREDAPGALHHVSGRGIARRTIADSQREIRYFLSLFARAARRGWIEILSFCVLSNHYHLLARTGKRPLAYTMQWVLAQHVRRFNIRRERDGPLFKSRYWSRRIEDEGDRFCVIRYIDQNPVAAGIVTRASDYPFGSARSYVHRRGPKWLERRTVEDEVRGRTGVFSPDGYERVFAAAASQGLAWIVERRLHHPDVARRSADGLALGGSGALRSWMIRAATDADGIGTPHILIPPDVVIALVEEVTPEPESSIPNGSPQVVAAALRSGLLRSASGLSLREICATLGRTRHRVVRDLERHRELSAASETYQALAVMVLRRGLAERYASSVTIP